MFQGTCEVGSGCVCSVYWLLIVIWFKQPIKQGVRLRGGIYKFEENVMNEYIKHALNELTNNANTNKVKQNFIFSNILN